MIVPSENVDGRYGTRDDRYLHASDRAGGVCFNRQVTKLTSHFVIFKILLLLLSIPSPTKKPEDCPTPSLFLVSFFYNILSQLVYYVLL